MTLRHASAALAAFAAALFLTLALGAPPASAAECTPARYGQPGCPYPSLGSNDTFRPNTDRPGSDYTSFDINGQPVDCQNACTNDARCRAWTWVKPGVQGPKARCWLKTAEPREIANNCCFSGRNPNPAPPQKPIKTTGKPKPAGTAGLSADAQAILNAHNAYRAKHCVGLLTWSASLATQAQNWANQCTKNGNLFAHSGFNGYGENLAWGGGLGAKAAVDLWYAEVSKYNFSSPAWSNAVGHFTQLVWRATTQVGCGVATCGGQRLWVCQYTPPGNWNVNNPGVMASNVPAACK